MTADESDPPSSTVRPPPRSRSSRVSLRPTQLAVRLSGRRSRSDNHHDAEQLLGEIAPGGKTAASHLRNLINLKDTAHYGFIAPSASELKRSLRQAEHLVGFAERVVRRDI